MGLAITKKLIDLMNGTINVESQFGKGSMFVVQIPQRISKMVSTESVKNIQLYLIIKLVILERKFLS